MKLLNAFSANMLNPDIVDTNVSFTAITLDTAKSKALGLQSCIGHQDTANVLSELLGIVVPMNRCTVELSRGETALLAQYRGDRLPENATALPHGATITFYLVTVE